MKLAKAMRYGGELIEACDCDYSDFKALIPLCPNCSEPVFLRKGSDRKSKLGKEFKIPQHWSHQSRGKPGPSGRGGIASDRREPARLMRLGSILLSNVLLQDF